MAIVSAIASSIGTSIGNGVTPSSGDELVPNTMFETADGWTLGTDWSISGGVLQYIGAGGDVASIPLRRPATAEAQYVITINIDGAGYSDTAFVIGSGEVFPPASGLSSGVYQMDAGATLSIVGSTLGSVNIYYISVREV